MIEHYIRVGIGIALGVLFVYMIRRERWRS